MTLLSANWSCIGSFYGWKILQIGEITLVWGGGPRDTYLICRLRPVGPIGYRWLPPVTGPNSHRNIFQFKDLRRKRRPEANLCITVEKHPIRTHNPLVAGSHPADRTSGQPLWAGEFPAVRQQLVVLTRFRDSYAGFTTLSSSAWLNI
jgi:hypothetical protein